VATSNPHVVFSTGTFTFAAAVALPNNCVIEGSGWQTILSGDNIFTVAAKTNFVIKDLYMLGSTASGHTAISIAGASSYGKLLGVKTENYIRSWYHDTTGSSSNVEIKDCTFLTGRSADWAPVFDYRVVNFEVSGCTFKNCHGAGVYVAGGNSIRIVSNDFNNCSFSKGDSGAIVLTNRVDISDFVIADNTITMPDLDAGNKHGIVISGEFTSAKFTTDGTISGNKIRGVSDSNNCGNAIYLSGQISMQNILHISIIGNTVHNVSRGILMTQAAHVTINSNTIHDTNLSAIGWDSTVDDITIRNNVGFVTENSGNNTGTGSQQTIAHGCNFTPTLSQVQLSERSTGGALAYQSAAPDATNIYVTATNEKDYNWKVSYNP
jgi:hypothetical protein